MVRNPSLAFSSGEEVQAYSPFYHTSNVWCRHFLSWLNRPITANNIMNKEDLHIIQVGNVLVSPDIITEKFCCDLEKCKGVCCIEGDAGAPVTLDEIGGIEDALDTIWGDMSASAQAVVDRQGVAYTDIEGDFGDEYCRR